MIDCFTADGKAPPLDYLKSRNVEHLRFLALTHPHDDHFGGLPDVLDWFAAKGGIDQFWRYPALDVKHLLPLMRSRAAQLGPPFAQQQLDAMSSLQLFYQRLAKEIKSGRTELIIMTVGQTLLSTDNFGVEVTALAPAGKMVAQAEEALGKAIEAQANGHPVPYWDLNRISSAFLVRFSGGEALLGGDVPLVSWKSSLASALFPDMSIGLYKVSHHGSAKDNPKILLDRIISPRGGEIAVITRYSPCGLPRQETVLELKSRFTEVKVIGRAFRLMTHAPIEKKRSFETQRLEVQVSSSGLLVRQPVAC